VQVIDRFHLVQNVCDALERFFLRHRQGLKTLGLSCPQGPTYGSSEPSPSLATVSQPRHERWVDLYHQIQRLHAQPSGIAAIAQRVQVSRPTVYRYLAMPQPPERQRSRHRGPPLVAPYITYLRRRWNASCRHAQQLWREFINQGHQPSRRTVERYVGQWRRETGTWLKFRHVAPAPLYEDHDAGRPSTLTALHAARLFLSTPEDRRSTDQALLARLLCLDPVMPLPYAQVQAFCRMVRQRQGHEYDAWIAAVQHAGVKELRAFVKGWLKDVAAVRAGVDFLRHRMLATSSGAAD